jgi:fatty acid synthase subunit alpha
VTSLSTGRTLIPDLDVLTEIATSGVTFAKKAALLTGVGKGSIGVEILKGLLSGGAVCIVTTSRYSRASVDYYKKIFHEVGAKGSKLIVVPFNGASKQDVEALVEYIYSTLQIDLDYIIPFAALPENGRQIDNLDDKSELAHRLMLTNLLRLLGAVKVKKAARHFVTRPTQVVLPLSPNHGTFGNDGLYGESKISLETLFNRWAAESWGEYLCIAGAVIGWTRGTGLMSATNFVAEGLEKLGVRTFSAKEMAFNILGLMHPLLFDITQIEPIWADLNGAMDRVAGLNEVMTSIRTDINKTADLRRAVTLDNAADVKVTNGSDAERLQQKVNIAPRANFQFEYPKIDGQDVLSELSHLQGLIDLDQVIVCTGFAEVGPWGSARTRWEMEARGEFTIEGCIEMAWMMGLIKHMDGKLKNGQAYVGWVDAKSAEPVDDKDVRSKYEKEILEHSGVRLIEPELFYGYDPNRKSFHQEVELNHDLEPAARFKREQGDKCDIWLQESGEWMVKFKKGARIYIPKSVKFDRTVAGQIPTGWDAKKYGIPDDIIAQVDR